MRRLARVLVVVAGAVALARAARALVGRLSGDPGITGAGGWRGSYDTWPPVPRVPSSPER